MTSEPKRESSSSKVKKSGKRKSIEAQEKEAEDRLRFARQALEAHNEFRRIHKVPDLVLNNELSEKARAFCVKLSNNNTIPHFHKDFGISQFYYRDDDVNHVLDGGHPVMEWYKEKKYAEYGRDPSDLKARWYYQIIWKDTKEMGIATVKKSYRHWVVAIYVPPGNVSGKYAENVFQEPQPITKKPSPIKLPSKEKIRRERKIVETKKRNQELLDLKIKESEERRNKLKKNQRPFLIRMLRRCFCIDWCCK